MNHQRTQMGFMEWWSVLSLAAIFLICLAAVWNVLVFCLLRRWFRVLPLFSWTTWGLMLVLAIALVPLIPHYPSNTIPWWPALFVTVPAALALLRWETKRYIWSLCVQVAQYENYLRANGVDPHGHPQRSGPGA